MHGNPAPSAAFPNDFLLLTFFVYCELILFKRALEQNISKFGGQFLEARQFYGERARVKAF